MDFKDELHQAGRLLAKEEYTASAARGVAVIEQVLRHVLRTNLPTLAEAADARMERVEGRRLQRIEEFNG